MFTEICLGIITVMLIALVVVLLRISFQIQQSIHFLQVDLHNLSIETMRLLNSMNEFVRADLHMISEETTNLITKLNDLSSDINNKSHSLNFLFKPFGFLNSILGSDTSSDESGSKRETIPQILKWIASSAFLFKTTKEFIKKYEKRT